MLFECINELPQVKPALRIEEMESHGRRIGQIPVLHRITVGGKESGKKHKDVREAEQCQSEPHFVAALHDHSTRIRGSFTRSKTSASRLPATRNADESMTIPATT